MDISAISRDDLAQGVLERVFMRNPRGAHTLSNALRDASDALGARTKEDREAVVARLVEGFTASRAGGRSCATDARRSSPGCLRRPSSKSGHRAPGR
jgi:hypothetical protein